MYSDHHIPETVYRPSAVQRVYRKEVLACIQSGTYMGIWQLHALSSVMMRPIRMVYPSDRGLNVRSDSHRLILPRNCEYQQEAMIMWSSTRYDDMRAAFWVPTHFVSLLPVSHDLDESPVQDDLLEPAEDASDYPNIINMTMDYGSLDDWSCDIGVDDIIASLDHDNEDLQDHEPESPHHAVPVVLVEDYPQDHEPETPHHAVPVVLVEDYPQEHAPGTPHHSVPAVLVDDDPQDQEPGTPHHAVPAVLVDNDPQDHQPGTPYHAVSAVLVDDDPQDQEPGTPHHHAVPAVLVDDDPQDHQPGTPHHAVPAVQVEAANDDVSR